MKISKLFHWLYAILMLLPAFAISVTCAYVIFNDNSVQESEIIYYESNEVSSINDLIEGNIYHLTYNSSNRPSNTQFLYIDDFYNMFAENLGQYESNTIYDVPCFAFTNSSVYLYTEVINNKSQGYTTNQNFSCDFIYRSNSNFTKIEYISKSDYKLIKSENDFVSSNAFYYSIDKVEQSPLFNWAYDSFLVQPITYITSLFGMPDDNVAILLMSYWLDISIIYLVFDMIMYVPLLVHRWLDKGVLE